MVFVLLQKFLITHLFRVNDYYLMKYFILFLFSLVLFTCNAQRYQKNKDIGVFIGGSYYQGDLNYESYFHDTHLSFGIIYRINYTPHYSLRYGITRAGLSGNDADFSDNFYQKTRNHAFSSNVIDLSTMLEYNFFPITDEKSKLNLSPYFNIGLAFYHASNRENLLSMAIPIGLGIKKKLSPKWTIQAEWNYRITFTDELDGLDYYNDTRNYKKKQNSFSYTKDLYSIFGVSILYQFKKKKVECPGYK